MIDIGLSKMALIGAVALVVIGPEKLPRVARTVGTLLGKAQRYVADVKAEVNQAMELDELRRVQRSVREAARDVRETLSDVAREATQGLEAGPLDGSADAQADGFAPQEGDLDALPPHSHVTPLRPFRPPPRKNWRLKRAAMPHWFKSHAQVRRHVTSGAARVARFRPPR